MPIFEWSDGHCAEISANDSHQEKLFELVNQLNDVVKSGSNIETVANLINDVDDYAHNHYGKAKKHLGKTSFSTTQGLAGFVEKKLAWLFIQVKKLQNLLTIFK